MARHDGSPTWVTDIHNSGDRGYAVMLHVEPGFDRDALRALGGRRTFPWLRTWTARARDEPALATLLVALRDLGVLFLAAGPGWHPGSIFEELRERGLVDGPYWKIFWTGPGQWDVRER